MPTVPINLTTLPAHSIFSSGSGKEKQDDWELVDAPNDDLVGTKSSRMILRDKDLIVAFGSQVRICTLAGEGWKIDGDVVGSYKVGST
jgi:nucleoporin NUP82